MASQWITGRWVCCCTSYWPAGRRFYTMTRQRCIVTSCSASTDARTGSPVTWCTYCAACSAWTWPGATVTWPTACGPSSGTGGCSPWTGARCSRNRWSCRTCRPLPTTRTSATLRLLRSECSWNPVGTGTVTCSRTSDAFRLGLMMCVAGSEGFRRLRSTLVRETVVLPGNIT